MQKKNLVFFGIVFTILTVSFSACTTRQPARSTTFSEKATLYAGGDELVTKYYTRNSVHLSLLLPQRCILIDQPRAEQSLVSLTSDNGKGSTCMDNINIVIKNSPLTEAILDEQIEESVATPKTIFGKHTGTWYEGKTAEGGSGYSFDYISQEPHYFWFNYMVYPRVNHENEFPTTISTTKVLVQKILSSIEITY